MNIFLLAIDPIVQEHKARTRSSLAAIGIADSLQLDMARIAMLKADAERNLGDAGCSAQALNERHTDHSSVAVCGGVATTDITLELANVVEQSPIVQTAVTHIVLREVELRAVVAVIGKLSRIAESTNDVEMEDKLQKFGEDATLELIEAEKDDMPRDEI